MRSRLLFLFFGLFVLQMTAAPKIKHVILIGCDGFGSYAFDKVDIPNIKKLKENGSYTLGMRTVLPSSSAVNWASMLMGAGPTLHGYTEWGSKTPEIPSVVTSKYGKFPSIYTLLREQESNSKTAAIYSWDGIEYLFEKEAVDIMVYAKSNEDFCVDTAATIIREQKPTFTFIHFNEPDNIGHKAGHDTKEYFDVVAKVDQRIGKIIAAVEAAGIANETIIIVTADHGGINKGHGGKTLQEVQVPFVICGPGIKKNHEIKDVMVIYDVAATLAKIFNLKQPQAWRGLPMFSIFGK